ncbi:NEL-type E3 ubiquitin ligase domain-containing protein [Pseudomonas marginalis]|uniref:RING-type E3 ubiquitin transferase n=2 Tax=Pseudomonas marginalis TaxID=298 RepID=A0A3M4A4S0_PSEMA|nr:NEL-type E3 ubiquitin ligase domain-containing protein [Pseudomonas marginalis]OAJ48322.1 hypothetical protein AO064_13340 [Pseudomonas marginalis]RMP01937.1 hypothetical protein ALQ29_01697 [Pseudomonas marginalis pv. marginalis]
MPTPSKGLHVPFIKSRLPDWTRHLHGAHLQAMTRARDPAQRFIKAHPAVFAQASSVLRQGLLDSQMQSSTSSQQLAKTLKDFQGITEFCKPLLAQALRTTFGQAPDPVATHLFHLRAPNTVDQQSLLQAALRNFEADEPFDEVSLQETSALAPEGSLEMHLYDETRTYPFGKTRYSIRDKLSIKPAAFASLCRELDLGRQYQEHLSQVFEAPDNAATVRQHTIMANKDRLRVQAHIARMTSAIDEAAFTLLLAVLEGKGQAKLDGKPVAFSRLEVLGSALSDVLIIGASSRRTRALLKKPWLNLLPGSGLVQESTPPETRFIVYIPGDPVSPVKEYATASEFSKDLAIKLRSPQYQHFFSGFVPQDESAQFFRRLKLQLKVHRWNPNPVYPRSSYNPGAYAGGIYEEVWNEALNLGMEEDFIDGEVFDARYDFHLARIKSNAKLLAIPTADVDHKAWIERLKHYAEWGFNVLNVAAFFVPGLGEVMLAVTAVQLSYEVYQGVQSWRHGDAEEAWTHLKSVMANVAFMAALGAVAGKAPPIVPSRFVNGMTKVALPFGKLRLWHPDLATYKSSVSLEGLTPNALGQFEVGGKTYVNIDGNVYEKTFDPTLDQWAIKHPTDADAYQPMLQHNGHGAWRHTLERPLEWSRTALLRRTGPHMERFSDAQLEQIADASGVSDDELRALHVDHHAPPPVLSEMVRVFEVDQQADEVIGQIRQGACLEGHCQFMVPLAVEMPSWPAEEVVEVFNGPGLAGDSQRFGSVSAPSHTRPTIKITQAEVDAGKLPERVLAGLDEARTRQLLGSESAKEGVDRTQLFRDRLADRAQLRKQALVKNLMSRQASPDVDTQALQRSFPSLSPEAAGQVLGGASAEALSQLRSTGRIPLRLAKEIRVHLHQGSLSRALAGLYLESMASSASDRLALHTLERLPGWSADIRVEVRARGLKGPLVDSIGREQAPTRFYLLWNEDAFRAFDSEGRALNSVPKAGRNLFESLVEVLPDTLRDALQGHPGEALHKQVTDYARSHRDDMSRILKRESLKGGAGRLVRTASGRIGYAASGDVAGFADEPLIARVRSVYPNVSDEQALQFIRERMSAGDSEQQVFHLLENRRREFVELCRVLLTWAHADAQGAPGLRRNFYAAQILRCWRNGVRRGQAAVFELDLLGAEALPQWAADFSHVRKLRINSTQLLDGTLRQAFPALESLDLQLVAADMPALAGELSTLDTLTELKLEAAEYSPDLVQALQGMTQLKKLHLTGQLPALDYSVLTNLRDLTLAGPSNQWPTGLLAHAGLASLDLSGLDIPSLPDALFSGHEPLWRSLRLNWGALEPRAFRRAFDYVHENPAHLVDESQMVTQYCLQRLRTLNSQDRGMAGNALQAFKQDGLAGRALLEHVEALLERYRVTDEALVTWQESPVRVDGGEMFVEQRRVLADRIRKCRRDALAARYGSREPVAGPSRIGAQTLRTVLDREYSGLGREPLNEVLDLTNYGAPGDLPALGDEVFPQIRHLILSDAKLSATQVDDFLRSFPELRLLNLSGNKLTELPRALETLGQLSELNLAGNELTITASMQARLNRLTSLQRLDLSRNRVGNLTVSSLRDLVSLDLGQTQVRAWPEGVLTLPKLGFLDLSHSAITEIPDAALVGHDVLLAGTSLRGCRLSPQAMSKAQTFANRTAPGSPLATMYARPFGIERTVLAAGRTGGDPMYFPIEASEQPDLLLPLPLDAAGGGALTSAEQLQRLDPQLSAAQAIERIDAWLEQSVSATQIETTLRQWQQQQAHMIERFNAWIDTPAVRTRIGWVNAVDRRRAADQLLTCWRETLREVHAPQDIPNDYALDLSGLILGDLPALPVTLNHVGALDLSNVRLTSASDEFLRAFPRLNSLTLNGNGLGALPEAVTQCERLVRLNASQNGFLDAARLQRQLRALPLLQVLDLEGNRLPDFDVTGLDRLQSLNLSGNRLSDWPVGVLQSPQLTRLDLRSNLEIQRIPLDAFLPEHAGLMAGTDLSDNLLLEEELIRLREYERETGRGLGFTTQEIDQMIAGYGPEADDEHFGDHPDVETPAAQKARWFDGVAADSEKHQIWREVLAQDTTQDFSNMLAQLQHTSDFQQDRVRLTERVWDVLEAAHSDPALSERLMLIARTSRNKATCGDGRILLFNDVEVGVYEFNALRRMDPSDKGRTLLKLSRRLFRLGEVEALARKRIQRFPGTDPAEIRLAYRTGLAQRLDLPTQPSTMLYRGVSGVQAADLDVAYASVIAEEQTPAFIEQLITRDYWKSYLQEKYPTEFAKVQQTLADQSETLEEQYPDINPAYLEQVDALQKANEVELRGLRRELSTREIAELGN